MALQTDLSRSPYFDDFDETANYYRVLYKPGVAVQAREMNQTQAILQNQVDKFGRSIFKDGSIVEGCVLTFDNNRQYIKISDNYTNSAAFTISDFEGKYVYNSNGLKALIVNTIPGFLAQSNTGNTNTLYIKYLNSTTYSNSSSQRSFDADEELQIRTTANTVVGNVFVASSTANNPVGAGYAMTTTSGVVFKKGTFLYVNPQTIIVTPYSTVPDKISVGFNADESIDNAQSNNSLYDNAAGSPNYSAPGADRLKIVPNLAVRNTSDISNTSSFFSLVDFKNGGTVSVRQDPQYAAIGTEMARRQFETNGDYVVTPFTLSTQNKANTAQANTLNLVVGRGLGYVKGFRVEYLNNNFADIRKSTDYLNYSEVRSLNFGYYIIVNEVAGSFMSGSNGVKVNLYNTAMTAVTSGVLTSASPSAGNKIGTAYVRGFEFNTTGTSTASIGMPAAQYNLYLFNVKMSGGFRFEDVKSIEYNPNSTVLGIADVVLQYNATASANVATITQPFNSSLIFPFNQKAIKENGFSNMSFSYKQKAEVSLLSNSTSTVTITSGSSVTNIDTFKYTGTLSPTQQQDFIVVAAQNIYSTNLTSTITVISGSSNVTSGASIFATDYGVGDYITVNNGGNSLETKKIITIANNRHLTVNSAFTFTNSAANYCKTFPSGSIIPLSNKSSRTIVATDKTAVITIGDFTPNTAYNLNVFYSVDRANTQPATKVINTGTYVKIDCANNAGGASGPWSLGLPDVLKIEKIYVGTGGSYSNSGTNYSDYFILDNGQRDGHYDLANIKLAPNSPSSLITKNSTILVQLTNFTYNTSSGAGFFIASSYPIDANIANTSAISLAQIPLYTNSRGSIFDLRDSVDFRLVAANTATISNTVNGATINPSSNLTLSGTSYIPTPDSSFETDMQFYLRRIDRIQLDTSGNIVVSESIPVSSNPVPPLEKSGTMTLGLLNIPPYPSLTSGEAKTYNRHDYAITSSLFQNRRWTMKDIGSLQKRIENIEYYTSLSLLEQAASNLLVRSSVTGQNRFQNGFFVESFKGFDRSNTIDPKFYIAIDSNKLELRPAFAQYRSTFMLDKTRSTGVSQYPANAAWGEDALILLNNQTANTSYQSQPFASAYINVVNGTPYRFTGTVTLNPSGTDSPDITKGVDVTNNLDLAQNWLNLKNAWGTQWGNFEDISTTSANTLINSGDAQVTNTVTNSDGSKDQTLITQVLQTTTTKQSRTGTVLDVTAIDSALKLFTGVTSITVLPFLKAATVKFSASGLKPNTPMYAYFQNTPVTKYCSQQTSAFSTIPQSATFGGGLITDSYGNLYGYFNIPDGTYKSEENTFLLADVDSLLQGAAAIQTRAEAVFYGSKLSYALGSSTLNTKQATVSSHEVTDTRDIQGLKVADFYSTNHIDPPASGGGGCGCKIICTKLYELGLMDEETFKADQAFGELLRENDPDVYNGYVRWASIVVDWMSGNNPNVMFWIRDPEKRRKIETDLTLKITHRIATPWAQHMQYLMGKREEDNKAGRIIMKIGTPVSKLVSKLPKIKSLKPGKATSYAMIGLFVVLYQISKTFGDDIGFPEPINIKN